MRGLYMDQRNICSLCSLAIQNMDTDCDFDNYQLKPKLSIFFQFYFLLNNIEVNLIVISLLQRCLPLCLKAKLKAPYMPV